MHLLFVGDGNVRRSPAAELLCLERAQRVAVGSGQVQVSSAGLTATVGEPVDQRMLAALARRRIQVGDPRSRPFSVELAESADLVLCMTGEQRRRVLEARPRLLRRTFTLVEATELLTGVPTDGLATLDLPDRARELARLLDAARPLRMPADSYDLPEPSGRRRRAYARSVEQIARLVQPLSSVLFEVRPPTERADVLSRQAPTRPAGVELAERRGRPETSVAHPPTGVS
ncbi:arsenate reductase/protein-tyrosine-phosphatase family protein [Blastococcus haudaquaticus]|uniref:arsenate reductase/protein-tyrosine-phosphatase family protein n=1 Tax=Blastococcus haudaquaticus TaxID=1938745 RepID=UPI001356DE65|nr:hypothetical protein [Blastococcus haudaquaticus]